jgi:hypothetical protein
MAIPKGLTKALQSAVIRRQVSKVGRGAGRAESMLGDSIPNSMDELFKQAPQPPVSAPTAPLSPNLSSDMFSSLKSNTTARVGEEQMPGELLDLLKTAGKPVLPKPTYGNYGVQRTDFSPAGMPVEEGMGGYDVIAPNRESVLASILDTGKRKGTFPFKFGGTKSEAEANVLMKVGAGEGNIGDDLDMFAGVEKNLDLSSKPALNIMEEYFSKPSSEPGKVKAFTKEATTKPENFLAVLDESVDVYKKFIGGSTGRIKDFKSTFDITNEKDPRETFYKLWLDFRTDQKAWTAKINKGEKAKEKIKLFNNLKADSEMAGLLEQTKANVKALKEAKAPGISERTTRNPFSALPTKNLTGPQPYTRGMAERDIDKFKDPREIPEGWQPSDVRFDEAPSKGWFSKMSALKAKKNVPEGPGIPKNKMPSKAGDYQGKFGMGKNLEQKTTPELDHVKRSKVRRDIMSREESYKKLRKGSVGLYRRHNFIPEGVTTAGLALAVGGRD